MTDRRNDMTGCPVIAKALAGLRRKHGFWASAQAVADKVGISRSTLSAYENGRRAVPIYALREMAIFYGVEFRGVYGRESLHHGMTVAKAAGDFEVLPVDRQVAKARSAER